MQTAILTLQKNNQIISRDIMLHYVGLEHEIWYFKWSHNLSHVDSNVHMMPCKQKV